MRFYWKVRVVLIEVEGEEILGLQVDPVLSSLDVTATTSMRH